MRRRDYPLFWAKICVAALAVAALASVVVGLAGPVCAKGDSKSRPPLFCCCDIYGGGSCCRWVFYCQDAALGGCNCILDEGDHGN